MKKTETFLRDYRKIFFVLLVLFLASFHANSNNPVISNFITNLSEMVGQEAIYDIKPEMIIEGNTIHVVWIEQRQNNNKLYYCRSINLGETWQKPILIADQNIFDGYSNRNLAVDGNNVHIAIGMTNVVYYVRSTDGGSTFEPGKALVTKPGDGSLHNYQIRAANGKVAIAYQGTPNAKKALFMLSSVDGGLTFTDYYITGESTHLSDFWYDGNQMVVVFENETPIAGSWNTDCRVFVSVSNDKGFSFSTKKIIYTNEAGVEQRSQCSHDVHYIPKIAKSGNNIHIVFIGRGINNEWKTLYARSTDNGQTFENTKDINNGVIADASLQQGQETVVAKNGHVYMAYLSKAAKVYLVQSANNGDTLSTAKSILPEGYTYVGGSWFPGLVIDPTDASGSTLYIYGQAMFSTKSTDGGKTFSEYMVVVPIHENIRTIQSDLLIDSNGNKHWISEALWWLGTGTDIFYKFVGPQPAPGTKNKALYFETVYNSKLDVAIVPSSPSLDFESAITAEAWVKFDITSIAENTVDISFFAKVNGAENSNWNVPGGFMMGARKRFGNMIIYSAIRTDKGDYWNVDLGNPFIFDSFWHHVAFTYDANGGQNNFKIYVDGVIKIEQTITGKINQGNGLFMIGARPGFFGNSKYQIDNIRLWNRALSQDELLKNQAETLTGKENGLKMFLNFDDTFKDISGNGNDAIPLYWGVLTESDFVPVHIEEFETKKDELLVYPNPAKDKLTISLQNAPSGMYLVEMIGLNGQVLFSKKYNALSISKGIQMGVGVYSPGQYMIRMVYGNNSVTKKVLLK